MASPQQQSTEHSALSGYKMVLDGFSSITRNMQAIVGEIAKMSEDHLEAGTKAAERLRSAHSFQDVTDIQSDLLKDSYTATTNHYRKIAELAMSTPQELAHCSEEFGSTPVQASRADSERASGMAHKPGCQSDRDDEKTREAVQAAERQVRAVTPL